MADVSTPAEGGGSRRSSAGRGCLFWSLITLLLIALVIGGSGGLAYYLLLRALRDFSSDEALAIPVVEPTPAELRAAREKMERLEALVETREHAAEKEKSGDSTGANGASDASDADTSGSEPEPEEAIVLDPREINTLIAGSDELRRHKVSERFRVVRGEGDRLFVEVSWPFAEIPGLEDFEGRYFNGAFAVGLDFEDGELAVRIEDGTSPEGKELSSTIEKSVSEILSRSMNRRLGEALEEVETVEIREGKLRVVR